MDLRMQYVTTADGVRIAYAVAGSGYPLVRVPNAPFSHSQLEWRGSVFLGELAERWKVIAYDPRGTGLSDREVDDVSLEARLLDLEAVADRCGLDRFVLHGVGFSGSLVVAYTVRHPDRVSHLVLDDSFARPRDFLGQPSNRALAELVVADWVEFSETLAFSAYGAGREEARRYGEFFRACVSQQMAPLLFEALRHVDVTDLLPLLTAPTLVVQHAGYRAGHGLAQDLAGRIPDARLVLVEGAATDTEEILAAMEEFLPSPVERLPKREMVPPAADFCTILFTDVEGSTPLANRLGDQAAREVLRRHERSVRDALRAHGGAEIKAMGDGFMASFPSATAALNCAIAIQRTADEQERSGEAVRIRMGLNAGEPIAEEHDLFGTPVVVAQRICGTARGGEVLVSDVVRQLVAGRGFLFADRGETVLRGFEDPVRIYELRWTPADDGR